jgi:transglutaminase-like putative cysteine protease
MRDWADWFGNLSTYFAVQQPHQSLTVTATSEVEVSPLGSLLDSAFPTTWDAARDQLRTGADPDLLDARPYVLESPFVAVNADLLDYALPSFESGRSLLEGVQDLMGRIFEDFTYDPHFSTIATPLEDVLAHRKGVCQDFAHLAIGCLRAQGLAARYVSGYIETLPPPGKEKLVGADASHAWFSVYVPYQGWVDFDPTNNQIPMTQHVTTAWGRDYGDVTPLKGVIFGGGKHGLKVSVDMQPLG